MDQDIPLLAKLEYDGGYLALSDTHLYVVRDNVVAESLALKHLSAIASEEYHSFRNRTLGLIFGILLLMTSILTLVPLEAGPLPKTRGLLVVAGCFGAFFGLYSLWGVFTSKRIWWILVRYGKTRKLIPLPGSQSNEIEQFLLHLQQQIQSRPAS